MRKKGGNIRQRKDGRFEARLYLGKSARGTSVVRSFYGATRGEAEALRTAYINKEGIRTARYASEAAPDPWESFKSRAAEGSLTEEERETFAFAMAGWLSSVEADVKESSYANYNFIAGHYIFPHIGEVRLSELTRETADGYVRMLRTEGRAGGGGLSPKMVGCILAVIRRVISYAKDHDMPVPDVRFRAPRQKRPGIRVLPVADQKRLEEACEEAGTVGLGILLSLYGGLRIGEVCGLRWDSVDLEAGLITVSRIISRIRSADRRKGQKTRVLIGTPKTDTSRRHVPVASFLKEKLEKARRDRDCYVLTGSREYMEPRVFYSRYRKLLRDIGLPPYNYHALRHTFATRCVESGVEVKALSEILGHADISITLSRYVHPTLEQKKKQILLLEEMMGRGRKCSGSSCNSEDHVIRKLM